jgi:hypothetical protein
MWIAIEQSSAALWNTALTRNDTTLEQVPDSGGSKRGKVSEKESSLRTKVILDSTDEVGGCSRTQAENVRGFRW